MTNTPAAPTYAAGRARTVVAPSSDADIRAAAFQFLSELAAELTKGSVNLPCFPNIVMRIRIALSDPSSTPEKTVMIVGAEPRLSARLLQTANSSVFNPSGKPLTDLRTAITRLGHQLVQSATMAFAIQQMKTDRSLRAVTKPLSQLWEKSITVASICQVLARRTRVAPDEAFLTGLLHGIGRLYIMVRAAAGRSNGLSYNTLVDFVGGWHPSIGKTVLENWGFAEVMVDAVGNQLDYERKSKREPDLTDILIVSILLAEAMRNKKLDLSQCADVTAFATLGLNNKDCITMLRHAHHQIGSLHDALGC